MVRSGVRSDPEFWSRAPAMPAPAGAPYRPPPPPEDGAATGSAGPPPPAGHPPGSRGADPELKLLAGRTMVADAGALVNTPVAAPPPPAPPRPDTADAPAVTGLAAPGVIAPTLWAPPIPPNMLLI